LFYHLFTLLARKFPTDNGPEIGFVLALFWFCFGILLALIGFDPASPEATQG